MTAPIRIHPDNPKLFEFRGQPRILVCATEHYGAVMNRPFRYERYLADAAEKAQTLTRLFCLFREQQSSHNPYSTCKPESTDYISPYPRTGPGNAADGLPKYDLDQWNPEFFDRLHEFLTLASDYGIVVEVVILSNTYCEEVWALNPLKTGNNLGGVETIAWPEYITMRHPQTFARQRALVEKVVTEVHGYDNVLFEVCNEPTGLLPGIATSPPLEVVDAWQTELAKVIRETEARLPNRHLIAGQEAYKHDGTRQGSDKSFREMFFDVVNIHPLPNTVHAGVNYDLGQFMSKQLKLRALRDFCLSAYGERKPLNCDEDNAASRFKDFEGWTVHRKRAWTAVMCGSHYDYIDFSIWPGIETGTEESQRCIRTWMKHLSEFAHSFDLVRARPLTGWLKAPMTHTVESVFGVEGEDVAVYLADAREVDEPGAGEPLAEPVAFELPAGRFEMACFSPTSGLYSPWTEVEGGRVVRMVTPEFEDDLVARVRRRSCSETVGVK
ncbi:MAG: cellulase family glycosylhydrolase [Candidatus Hydrogenedentes bacterium]|nr:cellulase family glycosylhydrolase [Candidatus Hydrogenedentota bacterium]